MKIMEGNDSPNLQSSLVKRTNDLLGENYFQNCIFSPDGLCILVNSVLDNRLRIYDTPATVPEQACAPVWSEPDLQVKLCDTVRDFAWYPDMDSSIPATCCFLAASR
jgi:telomerase Cajal body protein 1